MLDDGPLGHLASAVTAVAHWSSDVIHVGEAVEDGARRSPRTAQLLDARDVSGRVIRVLGVTQPSEAWDMLFQHLRARYADATADFGEHEAIAVCACDRRDLTFVTEDKAAALVALGELGRCRVASSFDLWEDLRTRGFVDEGQFKDLCDRTRRKAQAGIPGVPWRFRSPKSAGR